MTSSLALSTGSGLKSTASSRVKIVVFAPMPSARDTTAADVKPGVRRSERNAYRTS